MTKTTKNKKKTNITASPNYNQIQSQVDTLQVKKKTAIKFQN